MGVLHDLGQAAGHVLVALPGNSTLGSNIVNPDVNYKGVANPGTAGATTPQPKPTPTPTPNVPVVTAPTGGTASPALDTGAVNATQLSIQQIAPLLAAALGGENTNFQNVQNEDNAQAVTQQQTHDTGTVTNQQNYDSNFMASIRAGIQGLGGLINLLRGSGAAGGTAEDQVKSVVGGTTANDIQTGQQTQKANQTSLDSSLSTFLTNLQLKRQQDADTHTNNVRSIQGNSATQLQDLYSKLAGFYGSAGQTAQADNYETQASAQTPTIAANTPTAVSAYDTTPVAVTSPQITAFAPVAQPNVVSGAPQDGQVGSGIFTISKPKKDDTTPAAMVPAAAGA